MWTFQSDANLKCFESSGYTFCCPAPNGLDLHFQRKISGKKLCLSRLCRRVHSIRIEHVTQRDYAFQFVNISATHYRQ